MPSISLCMIVKNEEAVLARCLDSIADLVDEIIIVDTGSTDHTKEIAARYTSKIYDYKWHSDFSAARNFSFSKASMEYIYTADADEILDEENRERFLRLKAVLLPEIELVQMKYVTEVSADSSLNPKTEYRPKLFKRLRPFVWMDPIHESVRLHPVVFDSDIEILHKPQARQNKRDFSIFIRAFEYDGTFSPKIRTMYARELLQIGSTKDFSDAKPIFSHIFDFDSSEEARKEASCILAHIYRLEDNKNEFFKLAMKDMLATPCAEMCYELGTYFLMQEDYSEAALWFYNAAYETESILDPHTSGDLPLLGLAECYSFLIEQEKKQLTPDPTRIMRYEEEFEKYRTASRNWKLPEEA
ncbi:MAG: glycosyltransferase family 2 protein [Clostridiales bacterium]|nr:glycosyltransferase family 2 protein [Clostridiales bacterium]